MKNIATKPNCQNIMPTLKLVIQSIPFTPLPYVYFYLVGSGWVEETLVWKGQWLEMERKQERDSKSPISLCKTPCNKNAHLRYSETD